ncbi:GspH/FimT family pseudopilin [Vibrio alginolyticus]|uniref:Type II secretion system protein H n=1 Tax=Vibrio alginolyticus TaxID=663 RepID=A0A7Y0QY44_VIBAL|nr:MULTISPECIES: GspH/FimT family pseudopilin [Vibrio]KIP71289.1 type IV pilin [Vibrio alginolyticus]KIP85324.1 type IV pilin [Vibrio alginolyticus]MBS9998689.1 GspH/FimT family pseudopilin [Vibrio alginolyticus]MCZ2801360.1 GspH/FimT family pseudopilin [Vibrio alginolyticus]MDW1837262.1 GspH/FimT family pseudopilin [Vibrio sp. Vb0718]
MPRGFTLLELLITVAVLSIILAFAVPSFSRVSQTVQMQRLATELAGFLSQSKSEAVMRNQKLYIHFSMAKNVVVSQGAWSLQLTNSSSGSGVILSLSGSAYSELSLKHSYDNQKISFDEVRGRPQGGNIEFFPTNAQNIKLQAKLSNPPGRIKICSNSGAKLYDYRQC